MGFSQGFDKRTKATLKSRYYLFPKTACAVKYDHDIIIIKSAESLKPF